MTQYLLFFINTKLSSLKVFILFFTVFCFNVVPLQAQTSYPVPPNSKDMLFYLQRTFNKNTIIFELNRMPDNSLDLDNPVKVYWIRFEENNQRAELTKIQKMLFGLKSIPTNSSKSSFLLVNKKIERLKINLEKTNLGNYKAFMIINNQKTELERVFVKTDENSIGLSINVKYIEVSGISVESRKKNLERILM